MVVQWLRCPALVVDPVLQASMSRDSDYGRSEVQEVNYDDVHEAWSTNMQVGPVPLARRMIRID